MLTMHFGPREVLVTLSLEFAAQISATDVQNAAIAHLPQARLAGQNLAEAPSEITTN
jgi:hypothetical protein